MAGESDVERISPVGERPDFVPHGYLEGVRRFCEGDYSGALRRFQSLLAAQPNDGRILVACGHCCVHDGNPDLALEFYERVATTDGELPDATYNRSLILLRKGRGADIIGRLEFLHLHPPRILPGEFYLGLFFHSEEEFLCDICLYIALIQDQLDSPGQAEVWYRKALDYQPDNIAALERSAGMAILSKNFLSAISMLNRILVISPLDEDKIKAHNNLGIACYENGMLEEAIEHLTWVLKRSPANPTAIHNLNFIYEREGILTRQTDGAGPIRFMDVEEVGRPIFQLGMTDGEPGDSLRVTVVGKSNEMMRVMRHARVAAASDSPVLIRGENGVGKELLAQLISLNSSRCDAPFVVINCSAVPEVTLESELFGHDKGAFTGARARRQGAFELAANGTVFIDEVSALTPRLQGRLMRALREREFTPLGGIQKLPLRIRLITATNRDLHALVQSGAFREDLYYDLDVIPIEVPPLRDRREDIPLLVDHFLRKFARQGIDRRIIFSEDDLRTLVEYDWPGNVRELENLVQRAVILGSQSNLYLEELARLRRSRSDSPSDQVLSPTIRYPREITLADLEKRHILTVLEHCGQNQRQAARILGINPSTLWRKMKTYDKDS